MRALLYAHQMDSSPTRVLSPRKLVWPRQSRNTIYTKSLHFILQWLRPKDSQTLVSTIPYQVLSRDYQRDLVLRATFGRRISLGKHLRAKERLYLTSLLRYLTLLTLSLPTVLAWERVSMYPLLMA